MPLFLNFNFSTISSIANENYYYSNIQITIIHDLNILKRAVLYLNLYNRSK